MSQSLIQIGKSGLTAAQYALATTGNNISNASTPGYAEEVVNYSEAVGQNMGAGYLGSGVNVVTVQRQYAAYLNQQLNTAIAQGGTLTSYNNEAQQVNSIVSDPTAGITTQLTDLNSGLSTVANNPELPSSIAAAIGNMQSLVSQFNQMTTELTGVNNGINSQLTTSVSTVNQLSAQIASLNQQIVVAQGTSGNQPPNQLLDARDAAVTQLSQLVGATTTTNADGTINVQIGNGQSLVNGQYSYNLTTVPSASDPSELSVAYEVPNTSGGTTTIPISASALSSGTIGGLLQYRSQTLDPQQRALGNIAVTLGTMMNEQNEAGITSTGQQGGALFNVTQPTVAPGTANTVPAGATVTATYGGPTLSQLTGDNYTLTFNAGTYTLTDTTLNSAPVTVTPDASGNINIDGLTINVAGTPANGDTYQINSDTRSAGATISMAVSESDTDALATGSPQATATNGTTAVPNTGTGAMTITSPPAQFYTGAMMQGVVTATVDPGGTTMSFAQTTAGDALPDVTVTLNGVSTTYAPPNNVPITPGATYNAGGVTFTMSGTPNAGDTFTLTSTPTGQSDNTNALAMANLVNASTTMGNQSFAGAYGNFVGAVGDAESTSNTANQAQTTLISQVTQAQQSVSGVNLDEEATNMMTYEQMYQANSKVIQAASTIFDAIIGITS